MTPLPIFVTIPLPILFGFVAWGMTAIPFSLLVPRSTNMITYSKPYYLGSLGPFVHTYDDGVWVSTGRINSLDNNEVPVKNQNDAQRTFNPTRRSSL